MLERGVIGQISRTPVSIESPAPSDTPQPIQATYVQGQEAGFEWRTRLIPGLEIAKFWMDRWPTFDVYYSDSGKQAPKPPPLPYAISRDYVKGFYDTVTVFAEQLAGSPGILLSPIFGQVPTKTVVAGSGFSPSSVVSITIAGEILTVKSDQYGKFALTSSIPVYTKPGPHNVVASDSKGKEATATFTVTRRDVILVEDAFAGMAHQPVLVYTEDANGAWEVWTSPGLLPLSIVEKDRDYLIYTTRPDAFITPKLGTEQLVGWNFVSAKRTQAVTDSLGPYVNEVIAIVSFEKGTKGSVYLGPMVRRMGSLQRGKVYKTLVHQEIGTITIMLDGQRVDLTPSTDSFVWRQ